jgi:pimeloyl-ACP methyl ester carboxylesterase
LTAEPNPRWVTNGTVRLAVREYGDPQAPPILALHGFPENATTWEPVAERLTSSGRRVIAPDLRGHGESDAPGSVRAYRVDRLLDDVEVVIRELDLGPADVLAHDWGGGLAWLLAERRPHMVRRATILNVPHPAVLRRAILRDPDQRRRSRYILKAQIPLLPERRLGKDNAAALAALFPPAFYSTEILERYRARWMRPGVIRGMLNWYRAAARDRSLRPPPAGSIRVPITLLWGRDDPLFAQRVIDDSLALCADATVRYLDGCGHAPQRENPAAVAAVMME